MLNTSIRRSPRPAGVPSRVIRPVIHRRNIGKLQQRHITHLVHRPEIRRGHGHLLRAPGNRIAKRAIVIKETNNAPRHLRVIRILHLELPIQAMGGGKQVRRAVPLGIVHEATGTPQRPIDDQQHDTPSPLGIVGYSIRVTSQGRDRRYIREVISRFHPPPIPITMVHLAHFQAPRESGSRRLLVLDDDPVALDRSHGQ